MWGNFEWMAVFTLVLLALVFAPFYFRSKISTLPEFLERRYSPASRSFLAFMAIMAALFIHIGMSIYAGAAVFQQFFGIDVVTSIVAVAVVVSVYTLLGGFARGGGHRDREHRIPAGRGVHHPGLRDPGASRARHPHSGAVPRGAQTGPAFDDPGAQHGGAQLVRIGAGLPGDGDLVLGAPTQTIVQRVLGARTERDAELGPLLAGFLKILPVFLLVLPGVIGWVLFRDVIGTSANQTLPVLINQLIPTGLKGLISAAVLAALLSAVSAALNSSGTLVAVDIVGRLKPGISDRAQVNIARVSSAAVIDSGGVVVHAGRPLLQHLRGDQRHCGQHRPAHHLRVPVRRLLAAGHQGGRRSPR